MKARVDFFKPSGKWYAEEQVNFAGVSWKAKEDLEKHLQGRYRGMTAVITAESPWGFPVMIRIPEDSNVAG